MPAFTYPANWEDMYGHTTNAHLDCGGCSKKINRHVKNISFHIIRRLKSFFINSLTYKNDRTETSTIIAFCKKNFNSTDSRPKSTRNHPVRNSLLLNDSIDDYFVIGDSYGIESNPKNCNYFLVKL